MKNLLKGTRLPAIIFAVSLILTSLTGCGNKTASEIGIMEQKYEGDNIVEIPMIHYDGDNPELEMLNNDIKARLMLPYNDFMDSNDDHSWIEIKTYPFTGKKMIQLVITRAFFPNYATEGEIMSYNYDREKNEWVSLETTCKRLGIDVAFIEKAARNDFVPSNDKEFVNKVEVSGFRYIDDKKTEFFLRLYVTNPESDPWDGLYRYLYTPEKQSLLKMDMEAPFELSELDKIDPPFHYARK